MMTATDHLRSGIERGMIGEVTATPIAKVTVAANVEDPVDPCRESESAIGESIHAIGICTGICGGGMMSETSGGERTIMIEIFLHSGRGIGKGTERGIGNVIEITTGGIGIEEGTTLMTGLGTVSGMMSGEGELAGLNKIPELALGLLHNGCHQLRLNWGMFVAYQRSNIDGCRYI